MRAPETSVENAPVPQAAGGFGVLLRRWRRHRGLSQLDLAHGAGLSPRHLSFLETGRASPSRVMVGRLVESLHVPSRERNRFLLAAGYAPAYPEGRLQDPEMKRIRRAIGSLLRRHEPWPGYAMDGAWNVVLANRAHEALVTRLIPDPPRPTRNLLELLLDPALLRPHVLNWEECASIVLRRVRRQLDHPDPHPELQKRFADVRALPGVEALLAGAYEPGESELFVPIAIRNGDRAIRWMTTILTIGGAIDVTLEELVVECFFPADDASESEYRDLARKLDLDPRSH